jgi:hypothetical protein
MMQGWLDKPLRIIVAIVVVMKAHERHGQEGKKLIGGVIASLREVSFVFCFVFSSTLQKECAIS